MNKRLLVPLTVIAVVFGVAWYFARLSGVHNRPEVIAEQREQEMQEIRDCLKAWPHLSASAKEESMPTLTKAWKYPSSDLRWQAAMAFGHGGPPAVEPLLAALRDSDDEVRTFAVCGLGMLGPDAGPAFAAVVKSLQDPSADVRSKATFAVARIAPKPDDAIAALLPAFDDPDEAVRQGASRAVARFGKQAVPALKTALKSRSLETRRQAVITLGLLGPDAVDVVPEVIRLLGDPKSGLQEETAEALTRIGDRALSSLADLLQHEEDTAIRKRAILALGKAGKPAVPLLARVLADRDPSVRQQVVSALGKIGSPAAAPLIGALQDEDLEVRQEAVRALGTMKADDPGVVPALVKALMDPMDVVRGQAVAALRGLQPEPALVLLELKPVLADKHIEVRLDAIRYLVELGPPAVPLLAGMLNDPDARVRKEVVRTLEEIRAPADVLYKALLPLLKEEKATTREQAVSILWRCGAEAIPHLAAALKDDAVPVRAAAVWSLYRLNTNAEPVFQAFIVALDDANPLVRRNAASALTRFGTPALPHLKKALADKDVTVRQGTALALQQLKASPKEVLPMLAEACKDPDAPVRAAAATALGSFGSAALPLLVEQLHDPDEAVWKQAVDALKKIEVKSPTLVKALTAAIHDDNASVRRGAAHVLSRCGTDGVPPLVEMLNDKDRRIRWEAADSLRVIGTEAEKAVVPLTELARTDPDEKVRKVAVAALLTIHGLERFRDQPHLAIPALIASLESTSVQTRFEAAQLLGIFGPAAKSAVPALTKALDDPEERVRTAAAAALGRVK